MYKTASEIADRVLYKCAAITEEEIARGPGIASAATAAPVNTRPLQLGYQDGQGRKAEPSAIRDAMAGYDNTHALQQRAKIEQNPEKFMLRGNDAETSGAGLGIPDATEAKRRLATFGQGMGVAPRLQEMIPDSAEVQRRVSTVGQGQGVTPRLLEMLQGAHK